MSLLSTSPFQLVCELLVKFGSNDVPTALLLALQ